MRRRSYRKGDLAEAVVVCLFSGFIAGCIVLITMLAMEAVFHNALSQSPSVLSEYAKFSSRISLTWFMYLDALVGGLNTLWVGPAAAVLFGSIGGGLGLLAHRVFNDRHDDTGRSQVAR
jgi:hypothetical protein